MKEYIRTQRVEAIQWTGDNKEEIKNALGYDFDALKDYEPNQLGYPLNCFSLLIFKKESRAEVEKYTRVYRNEWVLIDRSWQYSPEIHIVTDSRFKDEFVEAEGV